MKDKIISFILLVLLMIIVFAIVIFGYIIYSEMTGEGTIQLKFEGENGYPIIEYKPKEETTTATLDKEIFSGVEDGNSSTLTDETNSRKQCRYLYNQLDSTAKIIYDKLYENKENLKTGVYTIKFGNSFQKLLLMQNGDEELKKQYQSAIEALVYENPDIFYLDATRMYINIEKITKITGTTYNVYINNGDKANYLAEGFNSKQEIEEYEKQIDNIKNYILSLVEGKSNYEKIKIVHDYLIDTIEYDSTISEDNIYNICGALISRKCVCEGYAKAFQYLMNEIGIENIIVIGTGTNSNSQTENHAWNYVKLNEKWYAIDATWDDPIVIGNGRVSEESKHKYFLKGSKTMSQNHFTSGKFTDGGQEFKYPELSIEDYE